MRFLACASASVCLYEFLYEDEHAHEDAPVTAATRWASLEGRGNSLGCGKSRAKKSTHAASLTFPVEKKRREARHDTYSSPGLQHQRPDGKYTRELWTGNKDVEQLRRSEGTYHRAHHFRHWVGFQIVEESLQGHQLLAQLYMD